MAPTPRVMLVAQMQQPKPQNRGAALPGALISQGLISETERSLQARSCLLSSAPGPAARVLGCHVPWHPRAPPLPAPCQRHCLVTPQHFQARSLECSVGPWYPSPSHPAVADP